MALRLEIDTGGAAVLDVLDRLADSMSTLTKHQDQLTKSVLQLINGSDAVASAVDRQAQSASRAVNPWERLTKAQKAYQEALASGDENTAKMAELQLAKAEAGARRAENALKRRQNPTAYALQDMIMTSRFSLGPLMPLVGKAKAAGLLGDDSIADMITKVVGGTVGGPAGKVLSSASSLPGFDLSGIGAAAGGAGGGGGAGAVLAAAGGGGGGGAAMGAAMRVLSLVGPIATAFTVATAAVKLFAEATKQAKDTISGYGSASFAAGGGPNFGRLAGLGGYLGKGPVEMAGMARQWAEGAWGDIFAMSEMSAAGISPVPAKFGGSTDYSGKFMTMIERLVNMPEDQAFRAASRAGIDLDMLGYLKTASDPVRKMILNDSMVFDPEQQREAADAFLLSNKAMSETKVLIAKIGAEGLPIMNMGLRVLLAVMDQVSAKAQMMSVIFDVIPTVLPGVGGAKWIWDTLAGNGAPSPPRAGDPIDSNTKAMKELTGAVTDLTGAVGYGSGAARGALPLGSTAYRNIEAYYRGQAVALGAIVL